MKVWICAVAKMEELYIREWIEWYKQIGIDHIVIGDNNDSDYEKPLQPIIQDYIDEGFVELINKNDKHEGIQMNFYRDIYKLYKNNFDWIGFIDIDEFVELPAYNNDINLFLSNVENKKYDAVILPWLFYGDNENIYYENKSVKKRFTKNILLNDNEILSIKYFIKSSDNIIKIISKHTPLRVLTKNNKPLKCCDPLMNIFDINYNLCIFKNDITKTYYLIYNKKIFEQFYNNAYISHYITKSTEEFIKYKLLRGRASKNTYESYITYNKDFYFRYNAFSEEKNKLFNKYKNQIEQLKIKLENS